MEQIPFWIYVRNSASISLLNVIGATASAIVVTYGFAKLSWPGNRFLFAILIGTMFLPGAATLTPTYILFQRIGWVGTYLPLVVPAYFANAFNVFLLRQFFKSIPESLLEPARVDGASDWRILWHIIVPLSLPSIATVAVFTFLSTWDDFLIDPERLQDSQRLLERLK